MQKYNIKVVPELQAVLHQMDPPAAKEKPSKEIKLGFITDSQASSSVKDKCV